MKKTLVLFLTLVLASAILASSLAQAPPIKVRVVVGYENDASLNQVTNLVGASPFKKISEIKVAVFEVPIQAIDAISRVRGVRYVEVDKEAKALEFSSSPDVLWNIKMINANKVWDSYFATKGWAALGKGVVVAVLDTGIDYTHPELKGKIAWCAYTVGVKTYTGTNLKNCADRNGHGTHVAGIIAATVNGVGSAGVAPNVTLYAIKVLNDAGSGTYTDIAEGIILAVKGPDGVVGTSDDAKILSMSLGGSSDSQTLHDAIVWAYNNGVVIVVAAGNSGDGNPSTDNVEYPARYSEVIAVAAVDSNGNTPTWSSDGPEVDIAAPGVNVYSTYKSGGYATLSGTSMATPHVSGVVALIQALRIASGKAPLTPSQVYAVLTSTAVDLGSPGFDVFTGYGLVNAYAAVEAALKQP
ncbi:MAG: S8 family peptidase [Infirmifilum sp.]